jgi:O-antigen ligase
LASSLPLRATLRPGPLQALVALGCAAVALALGLAAGHPAPSTSLAAVALTAGAVCLAALARPFAALRVLAGSSVLLLVYDLPGGLGLNLFDLLLPCLLAASVFGGAIGEARRAEAAATDPRARALSLATRRLTRAVVTFYAIAALSIVVMVLSGRTAPFANSTFSLMRAVQGLLLFPLGLWWMRTEGQVHATMRAMVTAAMLVALLNTVGFAMDATKRAGLIWFVNLTEAPIGGPNEAASMLVLVLAVLAVRQTMVHRFRNLLLIGVVIATLVATFSRSGLLACLTFSAIVMPRVRLRWVLLAVAAIALAIPLVPENYWIRMGRTLAMQQGTFEAYTSLIRIYCWKTAWSVFLDNPILGVGYVAFPYVSDAYGELRIRGNPVDNYYLETAAGMGIVGVIALGFVLVRLVQLGRVVHRLAPAGTLGAVMGRYHTPLLVGLLIVNLTGNNFVGLVVLGQLSLWMAMLVRAGQLALAPRAT